MSIGIGSSSPQSPSLDSESGRCDGSRLRRRRYVVVILHKSDRSASCRSRGRGTIAEVLLQLALHPHPIRRRRDRINRRPAATIVHVPILISNGRRAYYGLPTPADRGSGLQCCLPRIIDLCNPRICLPTEACPAGHLSQRPATAVTGRTMVLQYR